MTHADSELLRELGLGGNLRQQRSSLRMAGLMLVLMGGLMLARHLGWWPEDPRLWAALGMMGAGIAMLALARKPASWLMGER